MGDHRVLRNPATGEEVTVASEGPDVLVLDVVWPRPGHRAAPHAHPALEERFLVVEGRAAFVVGDAPERVAGPGETVVVPPGTTHLASNAASGATRLRIEFRPPGRWLEVVERLFGGESPLVLLREYPDDLAPPAG
jgi:quercetin dioxygenase-like cupin family protein